MIVDYRRGGVPINWLVPPKDINMRIPPEFLRFAAYVGYTHGGKFDPWGTGFFVTITEQDEQDSGLRLPFYYFVTASHILDEIEDVRGTPQIRVNTKDGRSEPLAITEDNRWYFHPEDTSEYPIDIAVLPIRLPGKIYDVDYIKEAQFLQHEKIPDLGIGYGDEVITFGLFRRTRDQVPDLPIVRVGNVSMIPRGRVRSGKDWPLIDAYIVEIRSIEGLSGSPVFVFGPLITNMHKPQSPVEKILDMIGGCHFLGLNHGHYRVGLKDSEMIHEGLSLVIPAWRIMEVLRGEELTNMRKKAIKSHAFDRREQDAVTDSARDSDGDNQFDRFNETMEGLVQVPKDEMLRKESSARKKKNKKKR